MNKLVKLGGILSMMGLFVFVACKKDGSGSGSTGSTSSKTDLLTGGSSKTWRATESYYNDTLEPMDPCDADDRYTFTKAGNKLMVDYGNIKCDSFEINQSGTWSLKNNDTELEIDGAFTLTIQQMTASKLVFISYDTIEEVQPGGGTSTRIVTSKQVWVNP